MPHHLGTEVLTQRPVPLPVLGQQDPHPGYEPLRDVVDHQSRGLEAEIHQFARIPRHGGRSSGENFVYQTAGN